jgi:predicted aminopeptidase
MASSNGSPGVERRGRRRRGRASALLAWLALALAAGACSDVPYYWQAGLGQLEIIGRRRPIVEVLNDPRVSGAVRRKLVLVLKVQDFAVKAMALPAEGQYRYFTDLGRPYVSFLVVAAPPFSLQEHAFCYLLVGCLGYRGYFQRAAAEAFAAELKSEGLDVLVRPVRAYSTLGWFDDPVLNTFLGVDDTSLVGTILHEQAHRRYFLQGDTSFNESFAGFVEGEGVRRYLAAQPGGEAALRRQRAVEAERGRYLAILLRGRERLQALYGSGRPEAELRAEKARLFGELRRDYQNERASFNILDYDGWFAQPLNNAHLVGVGQYTAHLGAFRALFEESGEDFGRFYRAVETLGALPPEQRRARLAELEKQIAATTPSNP